MRDDKEKVMEILFSLFEKHQFYNIKVITVIFTILGELVLFHFSTYYFVLLTLGNDHKKTFRIGALLSIIFLKGINIT